MKVLTVVLAICMLSIIGCSNDNDAKVEELQNQIKELQQAQAVSQTATPTQTPNYNDVTLFSGGPKITFVINTAGVGVPARTECRSDASHIGNGSNIPEYSMVQSIGYGGVSGSCWKWFLIIDHQGRTMWVEDKFLGDLPSDKANVTYSVELNPAPIVEIRNVDASHENVFVSRDGVPSTTARSHCAIDAPRITDNESPEGWGWSSGGKLDQIRKGTGPCTGWSIIEDLTRKRHGWIPDEHFVLVRTDVLDLSNSVELNPTVKVIINITDESHENIFTTDNGDIASATRSHCSVDAAFMVNTSLLDDIGRDHFSIYGLKNGIELNQIRKGTGSCAGWSILKDPITKAQVWIPDQHFSNTVVEMTPSISAGGSVVYGTGVNPGDTIAILVANTVLETVTANDQGEWGPVIVPGTKGDLITFLLNGAAVDQSAEWEPGGTPQNVQTGFVLTLKQ